MELMKIELGIIYLCKRSMIIGEYCERIYKTFLKTLCVLPAVFYAVCGVDMLGITIKDGILNEEMDRES